MNVSDTVGASLERLSPAERKVAEVVTSDPEAVAFGTVAEVAKMAGTSGPTVVRFAERLGFAGFVGLQAAVRDDLSRRLRPAVERIRSRSSAPVIGRTLEVEVTNVRKSLEETDPEVFQAAVERLADPSHRVVVLASEQCHAPAAQFAGELSLLRDGVRMVDGSQFRVVTRLAGMRRDDTAVIIDLRRHERWVLEAAELVAQSGAHRIAISDSPLSPLARGAAQVFSVGAVAAGPFDSNVGLLALLNAVIAGVAAELRQTAARRLDALEATWVRTGALSD